MESRTFNLFFFGERVFFYKKLFTDKKIIKPNQIFKHFSFVRIL